MAHTPLLRALERLAFERAPEQNRRDFLRLSGAALLGAAAGPEFVARGTSWARGRERIVIVGAGIAGLVTAMRLRDAGIESVIYESSDRIGGRMHSERPYWNDGQHTEWCGAMVDTLHVNMHRLARRFGLRLLDTYAARPPHARDTCYLDGGYYSMADADRDFRPVYAAMQRQRAHLDPDTTYANATAEARRLDAMSMSQWIERYVPGGLNSQMGRLIEIAYLNEYGRQADELSAVNLVSQLGGQRWYRNGHGMNVLGYSDQRYIFADGSQALPERIAASLPAGSIRLKHRMLSIRLKNGRYQLRFERPGGVERVYADRVVLAIPFIVLRGLDFYGAGFHAEKLRAIEQLGYGMHTKLHLQFDRRAWMRADHPWPEPTTGQIWTTLPVQSALDYSLGQPGADGLIEVFTAGTAALEDTPPMPYAFLNDSPAVQRHVTRFFAQLDRIWPGVSPTWNHKATFGNVQADPNTLGSYSCWLVGQCTTIAGHEAPPQGGVHFAGEHTSVDNQGFMEGGAESGFRAADEILADYKIKAASS